MEFYVLGPNGQFHQSFFQKLIQHIFVHATLIKRERLSRLRDRKMSLSYNHSYVVQRWLRTLFRSYSSVRLETQNMGITYSLHQLKSGNSKKLVLAARQFCIILQIRKWFTLIQCSSMSYRLLPCAGQSKQIACNICDGFIFFMKWGILKVPHFVNVYK